MTETHDSEKDPTLTVPRRSFLQSTVVPRLLGKLGYQASMTASQEMTSPQDDENDHDDEEPGTDITLLLRLEKAFSEKIRDLSMPDLFARWQSTSREDTSVTGMALDFAIQGELQERGITQMPWDKADWDTLLYEYSRSQKSLETIFRNKYFTVTDLMHQEIEM